MKGNESPPISWTFCFDGGTFKHIPDGKNVLLYISNGMISNQIVLLFLISTEE